MQNGGKDEASGTAKQRVKRRLLNPEQRRQLAWRRLMACILLIPGFFSLLTVFFSIRDRDVQAALIFIVFTLLFSSGGVILWRGKVKECMDYISSFFKIWK